MKLFKIQVQNFRLLKDFTLDIETTLSLVIGKNNTGKTSILAVLSKFLNQSEKNKFHFDDFNVNFNKTLSSIINSGSEISETDFQPIGIKLKLFISYNEKDDLSSISRVMMSLDPDHKLVVLGFEYVLDHSNYLKLRTDFAGFTKKEAEKKSLAAKYSEKGIYDFLKSSYERYFTLRKKSFACDKTTLAIDERQFVDLKAEEISTSDIINFKFISAKRDVTNREIDKTLSIQTSRIYKRTEASTEQAKAVENFKDRLSETDGQLSDIYKDLFKSTIEKVKMFGGVKENESHIEIISTLQHREMLEGNTTVVYKYDEDNKLPEHYNGLGYMNLISMIFEIEILVEEFKRTKEENLADINLLFIEEPEAHTHPQMQYVFIKNIKRLLGNGIVRSDGQSRSFQYIISSHSAHIVADSDFMDIKYLKNSGIAGVQSKNLKDLEKEYVDAGEVQNFKFLKQYLTLNRAELFFADKTIFIEGDTERILLPAMMKKLDQEFPSNPLLSQNISIVEVGAHSQIFEKFIEFIGLQKTLIITDIDSYYEEPEYETDGVTQKTYKNGNPIFVSKPCRAGDVKGQYTSNSSLIFFYGGKKDLTYFITLQSDWKTLRKNRKKMWNSNRKGNLRMAFQTSENGYHARSFEDAFFSVNKVFVSDEKNLFPSLTAKWLELFRDGKVDYFDLAEKGVSSKPSFAIEILLNSQADDKGNQYVNWNTPNYIREALLWLKTE
jgi:predicted ATP-dependent endonuclease of OLD family